MHEQKIVNDYLEKLESESNRLVEDIEQLTAENQKLVEDLRAASLQNSTVSLDIGSVDAKLSAEISSSSQLASESKAEGEAAASTSSAHATESTSSGNADVEALKLRHRSEMAALKAQLSELERSKNSEIKKLNDEIGSLEDLVEDKIFGESELNDKVSTLSDEVDRLQRELQRAYQNKDSGMPGSNSKPTQKDSSESYASNTGDAGISDDEAAYCSICDEAGHDILDCPSVTGQSHVFKQEASIDSSRPYCDNCESFAGHWTDECPHGDEMF
ncbi:hypothetical protein GGI12_006084 [Dipsacomyces acuminosporus]|nr:hypothetical protein GGI12_006084 [Dipsacomyces acuminosporus]